MVLKRAAGFLDGGEEVEVDCLYLSTQKSLKGRRKMPVLKNRFSCDNLTVSSHSDTSEELSDPLDGEGEILGKGRVARNDAESERQIPPKQVEPQEKLASRHKVVRSHSFSLHVLFLSCIFLGAVGFCLLQQKEGHVMKLIQQTSDAQVNAQDKLMETERSMKVIKRDEVTLHRMNHRLKAETAATSSFLEKSSEKARARGNSESTEPSNTATYIANDSIERLEDLEKTIQDISRRQVLNKFGEGPHFVQFELDFSEVSFKNYLDQARAKASNFTVKLAPLDIMPHSAQLFLEQVSAGLWDGCSFIINAPHLLKASPLPYGANMDEDKESPFVEAGLTSPSFPEYSDEYPHKKYTLGFVGKNNIQGFYINTKDNTDNHGRGNQTHHEAGGGDPCFGEVVSGFDAILALRSVPTIDRVHMVDRVGIKSAQVVSKTI